MAIAAVSLSPVGVGVSVSKYVAAAIAVLKVQQRVRWRLDSMFTTLEGDPADLPDNLRQREFPSDREPASSFAYRGRFPA